MTHLADDFGRSESGSLSDKSDSLTISVTEAVRIYFFLKIQLLGSDFTSPIRSRIFALSGFEFPVSPSFLKKKMTKKNKNFR